MPLPADLRHFRREEFKHPDLVDAAAARWLDEIRETFGRPLSLTDDARLPGEMPSGASATSLHFQGRAFDLRIRHFGWTDLWDFVAAVQAVAARMPRDVAGLELELVWSSQDKHAHVGFFLDGRRNRLIVQAD